ncbi:MAG: thioredoxin family protein [Planctomycetes bacterium]|nr:thioredoxin family protein [Planctomycetota bacterium]
MRTLILLAGAVFLAVGGMVAATGDPGQPEADHGHPLRGMAVPPSAAPAAQPPQDPWLKASVYLDHEALARGAAFRAAVVVDLDEGFHVNANPPSLDFLIPVTVAPRPQEGVAWGDVHYPAGEAVAAEWADTKVRLYAGRTIVVVDGTVADDAPLGPARLAFTVTYQGCDAQTCYQPGERTLEVATEIVAADAAPAPANTAIFAQAAPSRVREDAGTFDASHDAAAPAFRFEDEVDVAAWLERGLIVYLALVFVGGLALNLTPCVFPLIPVTMNLFAQQGERRPMKVLPLAVVYVLGLAATFTVVGVLAALAGQSVGLVLQSPWGVLAVVAVLATMMASAFGAFDIRLPSGAMGKLGARKGFLGAAFMGMVMGAIAAPCVGPFLIGLIALVAAERSVVFGAATFFAVGLGLGLPYVFLGTFTGLINQVPRSGGWLVWTKRLLAMALGGLILTFLRPYIAPAMFRPMVLALFIFAAVYMGLLEGLARRPFSKTFWTVRLAVAVALLVAGVYVYAAYAPESPAAPSRVREHAGTSDSARDAPSPSATRTGAVAPSRVREDAGTSDSARDAPSPGAIRTGAATPHVEWTAWRPGALADAKAAGRGVLLYFGADWCTECRLWKARLFSAPEAVEAGEPLDRIYVDVTAPPAGAKADFADAYRGRNPPAVIVLDARGRVVKAWRDPPDVAAFVEALRAAATRDN